MTGEITTELDITPSRSTGYGDLAWHLMIRDRRSGVRVLDANLTVEQFSAMLASSVGCTDPVVGTFRGLDKLGMIHENKTLSVVIPVRPDDWGAHLDMITKGLAAKGDGWVVDRGGYNHHRHSAGHYRHIVRRWVPKEEE